MLRTQIYLPEEMGYQLRFLAQKTQKPTAEIIRKLLGEALRKQKKNAGTTLKQIANLAISGPGDLSTHLFDYLYGKKSDYARRERG